MESYDRLFPNQDTMPAGGFGNLIALPLQNGPRREGNTVYLDERFNVHPDQWAFLASVKKIPSDKVQAIADEAMKKGQVIGVPMSFADEDGSAAPWLRPPSRKLSRLVIDGPLPHEVRAFLAQRLFLEKKGLPPALLNRIKRLAAFQNPEFYKKQNMRFSTATTPRVICCAEDLPEHVGLPRGCRDDLAELLSEHGISLVVADERNGGEMLDVTFQGQLTPVQEKATSAMLSHDFGVFVAPPGTGKTVAGAFLIAARKRNTLVLVHRKPLLDQWVAQLSLFLGVDEKSIGRIGGGKNSPTGRLDVAMIQSLGRLGEVDDVVTRYGHVVVDECHHLPAVSFERVLGEVRARYVTGLTATPYRRDGHQPIIHMQCGPIQFNVSAKRSESENPWMHRLIVRETGYGSGPLVREAGIQDLYASLAADDERNQLIFNDVMLALEEGRSPILLTERKDHLDLLAEKMRKFARHIVVLKGGMKRRELRETMERLAAIPDTEERLVLATGRYIGEGFDDARLDTLFLALPVSWKGTLVQYAGRLHRLHPGKREVRIYDYVDRNVPMLFRMFEKRLRGYRAIGYSEG
ncbi:MAG TPA: DEAD/DEAH box helicase family protein [Candidatus Deferrimicrobium sp.]